MNLYLLAGGEGKRLRPITRVIPKPLVTVFGKTLLEHALDFWSPIVRNVYVLTEHTEVSRFAAGRGVNVIHTLPGEGTVCALRVVEQLGPGIIVPTDHVYANRGAVRGVPDDLFDKHDFGVFVTPASEFKPNLGYVVTYPDGKSRYLEKPKRKPRNPFYASLGVYFYSGKGNLYERALQDESSPPTIDYRIAVKLNNIPYVVLDTEWFDITYIHDLELATLDPGNDIYGWPAVWKRNSERCVVYDPDGLVFLDNVHDVIVVTGNGRVAVQSITNWYELKHKILEKQQFYRQWREKYDVRT